MMTPVMKTGLIVVAILGVIGLAAVGYKREAAPVYASSYLNPAGNTAATYPASYPTTADNQPSTYGTNPPPANYNAPAGNYNPPPPQPSSYAEGYAATAVPNGPNCAEPAVGYPANGYVEGRPVATTEYRRTYVQEQPRTYYVTKYHRGRSWKKSAAIVAGTGGVGAAIGAIAGGGKGAAIGGLSGAGAGFIYDRLTHNK